ncbi:hypothetical protein DFP72DRAFT_1025592 [Ephemerocybe angulata]|uniref:Uncharacterized protein n=1 Tax=Ephemerocybe angulata TaxID=980116 RepID=A0A8H6H8C1_9AGAR|nr:hypothetical protein DFP72DRAFT_1025592 [Tulosesus angulatus]
MVKRWIVEGVVDTEKIRGALDWVVSKWHMMLAGRVEQTGRNILSDSYPHHMHRVRIPLIGELPSGYESYTFSAQDSPIPLSHYTEIPIPAFSNRLYAMLFIGEDVHSKIILSSCAAANGTPIIHWNIARVVQLGQEYSCIGLLYSHGLFDGLGWSFIVHALVAEFAGRHWDVPLPNHPIPPGLHMNPFEALLRREDAAMDSSRSTLTSEDRASLFPTYLFVHLWLTFVHGPAHCNIIIPYRVHTKWVEERLKTLGSRCKNRDWRQSNYQTLHTSREFPTHRFLQALYSNESDRQWTLGLWIQAILRSEWNGQLEAVPAQLQHWPGFPILTSLEVTTFPPHKTAYKLAKVRLGASRFSDAAMYWKMWQEADRLRPIRVLGTTGVTDDTWTVSNVSRARVAHVDWTAAGGGRTLTNYVFGLSKVGRPVKSR